jgi:hypothetical protein
MVHRDSMAILLLVRALKLETAAEGRSLWKRISACAMIRCPRPWVRFAPWFGI